MSPVTLSLCLWAANALLSAVVAVGVWRGVRLLEGLLSHATGEPVKPMPAFLRRRWPDVTPAAREYH